MKITEHQLKLIASVINETEANVRLKGQMNKFLNDDYEPSSGVKEISNEFHTTALIKKKIDGTFITPKALADYMYNKYDGISKNEINDAIEGWYRDDFDEETGMRKKK